jgi:hypothetical protein
MVDEYLQFVYLVKYWFESLFLVILTKIDDIDIFHICLGQKELPKREYREWL